MKKITQQLLFLTLTIVGFSGHAQIANTTGLPGNDLIFYEDAGTTAPGGRGFTFGFSTPASPAIAFPTNNTGIAATGTSENQIIFTRPATTYPAGATTTPQSVRTAGNDGPTATNFTSDIWYVIDTKDLSAYDGTGGSKTFTFAAKSEFYENGTDKTDDSVTLWYATNFAQGTDPRTITWTPLTTITPVGASLALGADGRWTVGSVNLSSITCGTQFAIAIRRQTSAAGPNGSGIYDAATNRNGLFYLGDVVYTGTKATLSVADNVLNAAVDIYPNPVSDVLNIQLNKDITIKNVQLDDISGKTIYKAASAKSINVSNFAKGLYLLKVEAQNGGVLTKKIIVK